jgi:hypothetical protein
MPSHHRLPFRGVFFARLTEVTPPTRCRSSIRSG